jgi:putative membrane protein
MSHIIKHIIIRTIAVLAASYITGVGVTIVITSFPFALGTLWTALLTALSLALINHTIKPVFMLVSIPINMVTLGLFSFVVNGFMILLADKIVPDFSIPSLLMAVYFAIVLSVVNWVLHIFD